MGQRSYRDEYYPSEDLEVCQENIDEFFKFMHERHMIWHRRFVEKLPREDWTENHIFRTTKYTNIYRQLDRGSLWYIEKIMKPYKLKLKKADGNEKKEWKAFKNYIFQLMLYRLCNRIETFEEIGLPNYYDFNPEDVHAKLKAIQDRGQSVMTSAHLSCPTPKGLRKYEGFMLACFDLYNKLESLCKAIKSAEDTDDVFNSVKMIHCIGGFTAYEVYCDMCYAKVIPWTTNDFVNVGPGAIEGIRLTYPSTKGRKAIESRLRQLKDDQHKHLKRLGIEFKWYNKYEPVKKELSLRSIEHSLCEYSKYWLQSRGLGKKRMIFAPDTHESVISGEGAGITINPDANWKDRVVKRISKPENPIIKLLKQQGLSKAEMIEFIERVRDGGV